MGWWTGTEMANPVSGNTFMLILVNSGRKRPWGKKNKNKTHIPKVTSGHRPAHRRGKNTEPHPGSTWIVPMPELLDLHVKFWTPTLKV